MLTVLTGDCRDLLKTLPNESVHCCVTSPPYFGLRDYGTAQWEGGSLDCNHVQKRAHGEGDKSASNKGASRDPYHSGPCKRCGATRIDSQIGLEPTPDEYVAQLVAVFWEVRRVLKRDGTLWLNLGDSYAGSRGNYGGQNRGNGTQRPITTGSKPPQEAYDGLESWRPATSSPPGLKPKDLIGIPWMVAFALRADGWYLRSDIIWSKPNPMPESVTDRPTKAHEYLFLMSKAQTYYYDQDAIRDVAIQSSGGWQSRARRGVSTQGNNTLICNDRNDGGACVGANRAPSERNRRSVWEIPTHPYPDAHFATFPEALVEPCVLAGCPSGGTVLDPFAGSGTVGRVALSNGRQALLIELNPEYCKLIDRRCETTYGFQFGHLQS